MARQSKAEREAYEYAEGRGYTIEVRKPLRPGQPFEVLVECNPGHHWAPDSVHERVFSTWWAEQPRDMWHAAIEFMRGGAVEPCDETCEWWGGATATADEKEVR